MMTDPFVDMLTRIWNAVRIDRPFVDLPNSRLRKGIAEVLKEEGPLSGYEELDTTLRLHLAKGANQIRDLRELLLDERRTVARVKGLEVDRRVVFALDVLPTAQKRTVERVIASPEAFASAVASGCVRPLATTGQPYYKLRVSPTLRLIHTMIGETIYVVDVVEQATLNFFARQKAASDTSGIATGDKARKRVEAKIAKTGNQ